MNVKRAANMLRLMLQQGSAVSVPPRRVLPADKVKAAPEGPKGLPATRPNDTNTMDDMYEGENLIDPGVIDGVTATGGGAIIG